MRFNKQQLSYMQHYTAMVAEVAATLGVEPDTWHFGDEDELNLPTPWFTLFYSKHYHETQNTPVRVWLESIDHGEEGYELTWFVDMYWETEEQKATLDRAIGALHRITSCRYHEWNHGTINVKYMDW